MIRRPLSPLRWWALAFALPMLAGCAPPDNWRELHWPQGQIATQFPCKPDLIERAGAALARCAHREMEFALAWQSTSSPGEARTALGAVIDRFTQQTGVAATRSEATLPAGALAWSESGRYTWRKSDGAVHVMVWARGLTVYQATVLTGTGAASDLGLSEPFFSGIRSLP